MYSVPFQWTSLETTLYRLPLLLCKRRCSNLTSFYSWCWPFSVWGPHTAVCVISLTPRTNSAQLISVSTIWKVFFCLHKTFLRGVFLKIHLKRKCDIQVHSKILRQFHRSMMGPFKASLSVTFWVNVEGLWITQLVTHLSVSLGVIASMSVSISFFYRNLSFWPYGIISNICYNGKAYLLLSFNMLSWI